MLLIIPFSILCFEPWFAVFAIKLWIHATPKSLLHRDSWCVEYIHVTFPPDIGIMIAWNEWFISVNDKHMKLIPLPFTDCSSGIPFFLFWNRNSNAWHLIRVSLPTILIARNTRYITFSDNARLPLFLPIIRMTRRNKWASPPAVKGIRCRLSSPWTLRWRFWDVPSLSVVIQQSLTPKISWLHLSLHELQSMDSRSVCCLSPRECLFTARRQNSHPKSIPAWPFRICFDFAGCGCSGGEYVSLG
jgi:hypothetical protein